MLLKNVTFVFLFLAAIFVVFSYVDVLMLSFEGFVGVCVRVSVGVADGVGVCVGVDVGVT